MTDPNDPPQSDPIDRRSFIERLAVLAAVGDVGRRVLPDAAAEARTAAPAGTLNGIQMGPHTILDEGIDRTLDLIADTAAINAVMPYSHAYNAGLIKPLRDRADHGVPLTDNANRRLPLVWVRTHEQYYKDTTLRHQVVTSADDHGGRDLFAELAEPARKRGMKVYARILESSAMSRGVANYGKVVTLFGYDKRVEPPLAELGRRGFTPDYVFRETKRSVAAAEGKTKIYTGVGFDVPGSPRDDPETVYQAVRKSFEAGAHGIVVSREYEEMKLEHLRAVGRAYRDSVRG